MSSWRRISYNLRSNPLILALEEELKTKKALIVHVNKRRYSTRKRFTRNHHHHHVNQKVGTKRQMTQCPFRKKTNVSKMEQDRIKVDRNKNKKQNEKNNKIWKGIVRNRRHDMRSDEYRNRLERKVEALKNFILQELLIHHIIRVEKEILKGEDYQKGLSETIRTHSHSPKGVRRIQDSDRVAINEAIILKLDKKYMECLLEDYPRALESGGVVDHVNHPIHNACRNYKDIVETLLKSNPDCACQPDKDAKYPLELYLEDDGKTDHLGLIYKAIKIFDKYNPSSLRQSLVKKMNTMGKDGVFFRGNLLMHRIDSFLDSNDSKDDYGRWIRSTALWNVIITCTNDK